MPNVFVATGAWKFGDPKNSPWTIGGQPTYHIEMGVFARYIISNLPKAKVVVLRERVPSIAKQQASLCDANQNDGIRVRAIVCSHPTSYQL